MRIAWVTYDFGEYSLQHVNAMAAEHAVLLVMPESVYREQPLPADPRLQLHLFRPPRLRQPWRQWRSVSALHRAIAQFRPDVIHLQHGHLWFNLGLPWLHHWPLVITIHDPRHHAGDAVSRKTPQAIMDFGFRRATRAIVHGQQLVDIVVKEIGLCRDAVHVIPHIAIGAASPTALATEATHDTATLDILFFGRIWAYKGLQYLIEAQPSICRRVPNARIIVAGAGEDFDRYRRMMIEPDRFVIRNDWIGDEERTRLFQQAALVVLPYTEATQSGVVPVAYSYGKPVVATRVGALADCIEDGITGLLVPPCDANALADAIVNLLNDPERRQTMGNAGRRWLDEQSSPTIVARDTCHVYQLAIEDHAAKRGNAAARVKEKTVRPSHTVVAR